MHHVVGIDPGYSLRHPTTGFAVLALEDPRWTSENRPMVDGVNPANGGGADGGDRSYFVTPSSGKMWWRSRQLRGPHLRTWA